MGVCGVAIGVVQESARTASPRLGPMHALGDIPVFVFDENARRCSGTPLRHAFFDVDRT